MRIHRRGRRQSDDDEAKILLFRAGAVIRDLQRLTKAWRANGYLASNPAIVTDILKIAAAHSQPLELEAAVGRIRSGKQYDAGRPIWLRRWARSPRFRSLRALMTGIPHGRRSGSSFAGN